MKQLATIIFTILLSITCSAQIEGTLWGCSLRESTKQDVKSAIGKQGYTTTEETDNRIVVPLNKYKYEGYEWSYALLDFEQGVFKQYIFVSDTLSKSDAESETERISKILEDKYKQAQKVVQDQDNIKSVGYILQGGAVGIVCVKAENNKYCIMLSVYADKGKLQLMGSNPIQRAFFCGTLGKSTKQEVKAAITKKGYKILNESNSEILVSDSRLKFEDNEWNYVKLVFNQGILVKLFFVSKTLSESEGLSRYDQFNKSFDARHGEYQKEKTDDDLNKMSGYFDEKTYLALAMNEVNEDSGECAIVIAFTIKSSTK